MDGGTCVEAILRAFNGPISEEQAWALCYQTVRYVCRPLPSSLTTRDLFIFNDGSVRIRNHASAKGASEKVFLYLLGRVLYEALDYGLSESEERLLEPHLESFIVKLTTKEDDEEGSCDEGIENDSEDDESSPSSVRTNILTIESVLQICCSHLSPKIQSELHFKAVCRALYVEYEELSAFLTQVSRGTTELQKVLGDRRERLPEMELEDLKSTDWARLWMQVIRQLRNGVKLKKVDCLPARSEFELTPYEMLLNDIRLRNYKLKHVDQRDEVPQHLKKDAHDVILDFIRSRPPLVPANRRSMPPTPPKEETPHDLLMKSIRKGYQLKPSPIPLNNNNNCLSPQRRHSSFHLGRVMADLSARGLQRAPSCEPSPRKHINPDLDLNLSVHGSDDSDDDDDDDNELFHSIENSGYFRDPRIRHHTHRSSIGAIASYRHSSPPSASPASPTASLKGTGSNFTSKFSKNFVIRLFGRYLNFQS